MVKILPVFRYWIVVLELTPVLTGDVTVPVAMGCRLAVAQNQQPVDPGNGDKPGNKRLRLRCRGRIGLHDPAHFLGQLLCASHLRLIQLHTDTSKHIVFSLF